jgi:Icc-related predicted phosphoesterase
MKLITISDVHGKIEEYQFILNNLNKKYQDNYLSIQLGDMGIGFRPIPEDFGDNNYWIRGNHDNPELAKKHKNYLGDYGYKEINGTIIYFLAGAKTPLFDRSRRTAGLDWWFDEELSFYELFKAIDLYKKVKPDIVLTHDCPDSIRRKIFNIKDKTDTSLALESILEIYRPRKWIFGHWHENIEKEIDGTLFVCRRELGTYEIDI